jgi:hypothetical protein
MLEIDDDCKVRDKDPVHPSGDGYTVITAAIDEMVAGMAVGANERKAVGNVGHNAPAATRQRPLSRGGFVQQQRAEIQGTGMEGEAAVGRGRVEDGIWDEDGEALPVWKLLPPPNVRGESFTDLYCM